MVKVLPDLVLPGDTSLLTLLCPVLLQVAGLVPAWIRLPLTQGRLTPDTLDVLLLQRMSLSFPVEDANMPSAHLASRPIRQLMYGLLLGRDPTQNRPAEVQEWGREGHKLTSTLVRPTFTAVTRQLLLSSLDQVTSLYQSPASIRKKKIKIQIFVLFLKKVQHFDQVLLIIDLEFGEDDTGFIL